MNKFVNDADIDEIVDEIFECEKPETQKKRKPDFYTWHLQDEDLFNKLTEICEKINFSRAEFVKFAVAEKIHKIETEIEQKNIETLAKANEILENRSKGNIEKIAMLKSLFADK